MEEEHDSANPWRDEWQRVRMKRKSAQGNSATDSTSFDTKDLMQAFNREWSRQKEEYEKQLEDMKAQLNEKTEYIEALQTSLELMKDSQQSLQRLLDEEKAKVKKYKAKLANLRDSASSSSSPNSSNGGNLPVTRTVSPLAFPFYSSPSSGQKTGVGGVGGGTGTGGGMGVGSNSEQSNKENNSLLQENQTRALSPVRGISSSKSEESLHSKAEKEKEKEKEKETKEVTKNVERSVSPLRSSSREDLPPQDNKENGKHEGTSTEPSDQQTKFNNGNNNNSNSNSNNSNSSTGSQGSQGSQGNQGSRNSPHSHFRSQSWVPATDSVKIVQSGPVVSNFSSPGQHRRNASGLSSVSTTEMSPFKVRPSSPENKQSGPKTPNSLGKNLTTPEDHSLIRRATTDRDGVLKKVSSTGAGGGGGGGVSGPGSSTPETVVLRVKSAETTYNISLGAQTTIKDAINRLMKRLPVADYKEYALLLKTTKSKTPIVFDENKSLGEYKTLLSDPRVVLDFDKVPSKEKLKKVSSRKSRDHKTFEEAIKQKDLTALEQIINDAPQEDFVIADDEGQTPLFWAVNSGNTKMVTMFLDAFKRLNLDINVKNKQGWTILHLAITNCSESGEDSHVDILRLLLNFPGIDVSATNMNLNSPLHFFSSHFLSAPSCEEIGTLIITKAPQMINSQNANGETALHKAMFCNSNARNTKVKMLISHGADVNLANMANETPLHYAIRLNRRDLVKILLNAGADVTIKETRSNKTPYNMAIDMGATEVADLLKGVKGLMKFLESISMEELFSDFLHQELDLEVLAQSDEKTLENLMDRFNIQSYGSRFKFKRACLELKEKLAQREMENRMMKVETSGSGEISQTLKESMDSILQDSPSWLLNMNDVKYEKEIGKGANGKVYKGFFRGEKVAVKVLKELNHHSLKDFREECQVMSSLNSQYVIKFFGASLEPRAAIVLEYCPSGSLLDILKKEKLMTPFDWKLAFKFGKDIGHGLEYLHSRTPPVFHRDVKSGNFLADKQLNLKICDMGLARYNSDKNASTLGRVAGTYCYMAPEVTEGKIYSEKCDIFSMGIVLWEIVFRVCQQKYQPPYQEFNIPMEFQVAIEVAGERGLRPTIPTEADPVFTSIIDLCLKKNPSDRPSAAQVLDLLDRAAPIDVHFYN